jgi:hypothetical protein
MAPFLSLKFFQKLEKFISYTIKLGGFELQLVFLMRSIFWSAACKRRFWIILKRC